MARPGVRPFSEFRNRLAAEGVVPAMEEAGADQINGAMFDRYSWLHFAVGVIAGRIDTHPTVYAVTAVAWEILEDPMRNAAPQLFPYRYSDSKSNMLGDLVVGALGYALGNAFRGRKP